MTSEGVSHIVKIAVRFQLTSGSGHTRDIESQGVLLLFGGVGRILRRVGGECVEGGEGASLDRGRHRDGGEGFSKSKTMLVFP